MSTVTLRSIKGAALTSTEIDTNFGNLNVDKVETTAPVFSGTVTLPSQIVALTDSNLPDVAPTLNLDFANSKQLDSRITFGRGSGGAYYDGKTTALAEQNLLTYSQQIGGTNWAASGAVITATLNSLTSTAPDGTNTASYLTYGSQYTGYYQSYTLVIGATYTISMWVKTDTASNTLQFWNTATPQTSLGSFVPTTSWVRYSFTFVAYSTTNQITWAMDRNTSGWGNLWVWGAQLEQRSSVTAYTPTTTAPITNYIPVLLQAPLNTPRFDHDSRPTFNGTCTVSGSAVTLPTTFADGSSPSTINKFYTGSITISGTAYVITNYVGSTRVVTVTGSPTAGDFSLTNKNYGQSLGLLIEESRTNLVTYSSAVGGTNWPAWNGLSQTLNTIVAPDGTLSGTLLNTTISGQSATRISVSVANATVYTTSAYVKAGTATWLRLELEWAGWATANYNLALGVLGTVSSGVTASIIPVGNGWYRCIASVTSTGIGGIIQFNLGVANNTFTNAANQNLYIWGAQLEAGSFATSYIPTPSNATVTRQPDSASMTGTNFSSWYNQAQGTIYGEFDLINASTVSMIPYAIDNTVSNGYVVYKNLSASSLYAYAGSNNGVLLNGTTLANTIYKTTIAYGTSIYANVNGATPVSIASGGLTGALPSQLAIGHSLVSSNPMSGHIRKLSYYPKALSAPQLQGLTK